MAPHFLLQGIPAPSTVLNGPPQQGSRLHHIGDRALASGRQELETVQEPYARVIDVGDRVAFICERHQWGHGPVCELANLITDCPLCVAEGQETRGRDRYRAIQRGLCGVTD